MSGINILRRLLLKDAALGSGQASGIMSIGDSVRDLAEKRLTSYLMSAQKQGVDIDKLGEQELKYILEMNKQKSPKVIAADSLEGKGITEALFGKKGEVFNLQGEKLDPNLPISGGTQQGKKINREFFTRDAEGKDDIRKGIAKEVQKRIDSGVAATVERILGMKPIDAMKEANSVIGRKGIYKNLSEQDAKKILQDTEDHIFERNIDIDPEDFAGGGVAGMLGERTGFRRGGRRGNTGQASQSLSRSSNQSSAGGSRRSKYDSTGGGLALSSKSKDISPGPGGGGGGNQNIGGGGPPSTNTGGGGGGTTPTPTTTEPSFKERIRQKQILNYLNSLEEEELASGFGRGKILGGIFKNIKPKVGPKELGIEYLKDNPFGDSLKLNLDTKVKDLLKGKVEPKLKLEGNKGNLKYGFDIDTDKNINFGIRMPFGKQPPGKRVAPSRFAPDILNKLSTTLFPEGDFQNIKTKAPDQKTYNIQATQDLVKNNPFGIVGEVFAPVTSLVTSPFYDGTQAFQRMEPGSGIKGFAEAFVAEKPISSALERAYGATLPLAERISGQTFADGGPARQNFKMGRRAFLKMLAGTGAGIAGLKTGITGLGGKKVATEVATEAVKSAGSSAPPPYFFRLVEKIKFMGDKRKTPSYKERVDEYTYRGKDGSDYELIEDLDTGDIQITKDKTGVGTYGDKSFDTIEDRTEMVFKKGKADETTKGKKPPDEYEEYKVEFDQDGTVADATDIDEFSKKELIEEAGDTESLTLKRAGGGVAYMLGQ